MGRYFFSLFLAIITASLFALKPPIYAELPPAKEIRLGMSTALTGPASALGLGMKAGIEMYLNDVNSKGGLDGYTFSLITLDDGYEPDRCAPNVRELIEKHDVFSIIGNVGTPTAIVTLPICNEQKTPFFGAFTGAGLLRKTPPDRYVFNFRASYAEETAAMIEALLHDYKISPNEIAFFSQNDGYGDAGYKGALAALKQAGFENPETLPHGRYMRNSVSIEGAFIEIFNRDTPPKAIIMIGAYRPCAAFIRLVKQEQNKDILFLNVSFVGSQALLKELDEFGNGVIITQVVPHYNSDLQGVKEYRNLLESEAPSFVSLEGFFVAKAFCEGFRRIAGKPTKEKFINALEKGSHLNLGLEITKRLSKEEHQISHQVWPTIISNGRFEPLDWKAVEK